MDIYFIGSGIIEPTFTTYTISKESGMPIYNTIKFAVNFDHNNSIFPTLQNYKLFKAAHKFKYRMESFPKYQCSLMESLLSLPLDP